MASMALIDTGIVNLVQYSIVTHPDLVHSATFHTLQCFFEPAVSSKFYSFPKFGFPLNSQNVRASRDAFPKFGFPLNFEKIRASRNAFTKYGFPLFSKSVRRRRLVMVTPKSNAHALRVS